MTKESDINCFGFFAGKSVPACMNCVAAKRCKAMLVTHGFDLLADLLDNLSAELPNITYRETDRVSEIVQQIFNPPQPLGPEALEALKMASTEDLADMDL